MNVVVSNFQAGSTNAGLTPNGMLGPQAERLPIIRQYVRIALRWRYVIVGVTAACFLLGLIATMLMTPKYTATSTVEISRESDKVTDFQSVQRDAGSADQEFYQTQYGLLKARSLSERVATQLRLVDNPQFFALFGIANDKPAFQTANGRYMASGHSERQRIAGTLLRENLSVNPTRLSRLVDIAFTSPDASVSAQVANAWADAFIQTNLNAKHRQHHTVVTYSSASWDRPRSGSTSPNASWLPMHQHSKSSTYPHKGRETVPAHRSARSSPIIWPR